MSKNVPSSDNSDGHDESTDEETQADNPVSRRLFLGAAAATSLTALSGAAAGAQDPSRDQAAQTKKTPYHAPEINRGEDYVNGDCGSVSTPGPIAEMTSIPDSGEIQVSGGRTQETPESTVQMDIITDRSVPQVTVKQILSPAQARDVAGRLIAAADVATGDDDKTTTDVDETVEADWALDELVQVHENIDWGAIPGISPKEAAAWTKRLDEALEELSGRKK